MEGNRVPEVSQLLHLHGLYFVVFSLQYLSLYFTTSYFAMYSREAESIGNEQREADIRPQQGKKIHGLVIGSVLRLPEEVHSMKNINTKPASFKNFTQRI